jgi:hypothetical protein
MASPSSYIKLKIDLFIFISLRSCNLFPMASSESLLLDELKGIQKSLDRCAEEHVQSELTTHLVGRHVFLAEIYSQLTVRRLLDAMKGLKPDQRERLTKLFKHQSLACRHEDDYDSDELKIIFAEMSRTEDAIRQTSYLENYASRFQHESAFADESPFPPFLIRMAMIRENVWLARRYVKIVKNTLEKVECDAMLGSSLIGEPFNPVMNGNHFGTDAGEDEPTIPVFSEDPQETIQMTGSDSQVKLVAVRGSTDPQEKVAKEA